MFTDSEWALILNCVKTAENNNRDILKVEVGTEAQYDRFCRLQELRAKIELLLD